MRHIPVEIVTDILWCLPAKPLLRFRCVSMLWCSLIDSPDFVKTHLSLSIENYTNRTLIFRKKSRLYSVPLYSPNDAPTPFYNGFIVSTVWGSCNGLLLLQPLNRNVLVLFNPSTRQHHGVNSPVPLNGCYGLGYDSVNDDYKIIELVGSEWGANPEARVCSLKSNLWENIGYSPYHFNPLNYNRWCAHLNGAIHMIVDETSLSDFSESSSLSQCICAFDVSNDAFYSVAKPSFVEKDYVLRGLDVLGGCLCLMAFNMNYVDLWVMKVYGVKETWTKLFSTLSSVVVYNLARPWGYSKSGDKVLLNYGLNNLLWYDLKRGEIKDVEVTHLPKDPQELCVESLVPLHGYRGSGEPKKQHKRRGKRS